MNANSSTGDIENLLFIMANLPDFLKISVCRKKVKELIEMTELEKKETIARSLTSINLISQDKLVELTKTWMKAMSEISPSELTKLLYSYLLILDEVKLFDKLEGKLILDIFSSLQESERMKLLVCLKEAVFLNPKRKGILKKIPADLVKVIIS
jgi:50S ribosomal subunit-associated GTPase HflX